MTVISVNRAFLNKQDAQGRLLPCVRIEDERGIHHAHAVRIHGVSTIGYYQSGRVCVTTDAAVEELDGPAPCEQSSEPR